MNGLTSNPNRKTKTKGKKKGAKREAFARPRVVRVPAAVSYIAPKALQPRIISGKAGVIRVVGREMVAVTPVADSFTINRILVNPGNPSFKWLSGLARNYQEYVFKRLRFSYVPSAPTAAEGRNMFNFEYDATDETPSDEVSFMTQFTAKSAPIWKDFFMDVNLNVSRSTQRKFVTDTDLSGVEDPLLYFLGYFAYATTGTATYNGDGGQLFVEYDVELSVPQTSVPRATMRGTSIFPGQAQTNTTPLVNTMATFDAPVVEGNSGVTRLAADLFHFLPGIYKVKWSGNLNPNWTASGNNIADLLRGINWVASTGSDYPPEPAASDMNRQTVQTTFPNATYDWAIDRVLKFDFPSNVALFMHAVQGTGALANLYRPLGLDNFLVERATTI